MVKDFSKGKNPLAGKSVLDNDDLLSVPIKKKKTDIKKTGRPITRGDEYTKRTINFSDKL
jgi:hypothetical protein